MRVLVLTPSFVPHKVVSWERAIIMIFCHKVDVIDSYDEELRSPSTTMKMPAVVRLRTNPSGLKRSVKFSRINVFTRDGFRCQYCGSPKRVGELSYDHVVPRHRGGRTTWENIVSACYACNRRKANCTPEQAGMKLLRTPHVPKSLPILPPRFDPRDVPPVWADWVKAFFTQESAVA
jgi:5-methylcytosine-specific restriction endonuclease McrA